MHALILISLCFLTLKNRCVHPSRSKPWRGWVVTANSNFKARITFAVINSPCPYVWMCGGMAMYVHSMSWCSKTSLPKSCGVILNPGAVAQLFAIDISCLLNQSLRQKALSVPRSIFFSANRCFYKSWVTVSTKGIAFSLLICCYPKK